MSSRHNLLLQNRSKTYPLTSPAGQGQQYCAQLAGQTACRLWPLLALQKVPWCQMVSDSFGLLVKGRLTAFTAGTQIKYRTYCVV